MRIKLVALAAAAILALVAPGAGAITYGQPDGNLHPNVGSIVADYRGDGVLRQYCSGTLISETVFLTASHCTVGLDDIDWAVTFDTDLTLPNELHTGTAHTNPNYGGGFSDNGDIAVIVFDDAVTGIEPARLPRARLLSEMRADGTLQTSKFTNVGYGAGERSTGGGPPEFEDEPFRQYSFSSFNALNKAWLRLSQNPATGDAGTCYGDSGGPQFLGGKNSNLLASITVTGDVPCRATNVTYRLDTRSARAFLADFVPVP